MSEPVKGHGVHAADEQVVEVRSFVRGRHDAVFDSQPPAIFVEHGAVVAGERHQMPRGNFLAFQRGQPSRPPDLARDRAAVRLLIAVHADVAQTAVVKAGEQDAALRLFAVCHDARKYGSVVSGHQ